MGEEEKKAPMTGILPMAPRKRPAAGLQSIGVGQLPKLTRDGFPQWERTVLRFLTVLGLEDLVDEPAPEDPSWPLVVRENEALTLIEATLADEGDLRRLQSHEGTVKQLWEQLQSRYSAPKEVQLQRALARMRTFNIGVMI